MQTRNFFLHNFFRGLSFLAYMAKIVKKCRPKMCYRKKIVGFDSECLISCFNRKSRNRNFFPCHISFRRLCHFLAKVLKKGIFKKFWMIFLSESIQNVSKSILNRKSQSWNFSRVFFPGTLSFFGQSIQNS